jgi:CheY-like chemotaxis protein
MSGELDLQDVAVLAVDDIDDNLDLIEEFLEDEVWSVLRARGGEEAIRLAKEHHPDVILLDLMMPNMNGLAIVRALRSSAGLADIGIILQTAYSDKDNVVTAQRVGCKHILCKPLQRDRLLAEIRACLRSRPAQRRAPRRADPEPPPVAPPRDLAAALAETAKRIEAQRLVGVLMEPALLAYLRRLVSADSHVGQRLVRVANSPFYAGRQPVRTVSQALVRIGTEAARALLRKAAPAARGGLTLDQTVAVLAVLEIVTSVFVAEAAQPQALVSVLEQLRQHFQTEAEDETARPAEAARG